MVAALTQATWGWFEFSVRARTRAGHQKSVRGQFHGLVQRTTGIGCFVELELDFGQCAVGFPLLGCGQQLSRRRGQRGSEVQFAVTHKPLRHGQRGLPGMFHSLGLLLHKSHARPRSLLLLEVGQPGSLRPDSFLMPVRFS